MVLHNPNNWHWVNKNCLEWGREYLEKNLVGISAASGGVSAKITKVSSVEGDMDVSQRKGKVITLFDVNVKLEYDGRVAGSTSEEDGDDEQNVGGSINIPEVAHDTEEDEYVFEVDIFNPESKKEPVKALVRKEIVPQLRTALAKLGPSLIAEHGKDIQHAPGQGPPTGYVTSGQTKVTSSSSVNKSSSASAPTTTSASAGGPAINTVPLSDDAEFRCPASELFTTFTDAQRIAAFTRSPPRVWEGAKPGAKFALFGGGVSGEYVSLSEPKQIVQKWRLEQWPQGHYSTLTLDFHQDDANSVTVMRANWDKVPVGEDEVTKQKWGEYYVRSLKTTFGFGTIL